jgi:hypothetical protein
VIRETCFIGRPMKDVPCASAITILECASVSSWHASSRYQVGKYRFPNASIKQSERVQSERRAVPFVRAGGVGKERNKYVGIGE